MLVSFAAAIEGGLAYGSEVTREKGKRSSRRLRASGSLGLSRLFSPVLGASVEAEGAAAGEEQDREVLRETRAHTEASIAILLYDRLNEEDGQIVRPASIAEIESIGPGALVELTGMIQKNAVDTVIDFIDAAEIFAGLADTKGGAGATPLSKIRQGLDSDRRRTPISNVLLQCSQPEGLTAVVTLRTENLRDLTLSELHKNTVRVLGKVTRVVGRGQVMSAFENYGLALMKPAMLREMFAKISSVENVVAEFSEVEVAGPAVQILPLMVFV